MRIPRIVIDTPMDISLNDPDTKIIDGLAYLAPDYKNIDYQYVYTNANGDYYSIIPPEEILPSTDEQRIEMIRILQDEADKGIINLDDFAETKTLEEIEKEEQDWTTRRDKYFEERGTTTKDFWLKHGKLT
jgi:hypothetical protein